SARTRFLFERIVSVSSPYVELQSDLVSAKTQPRYAVSYRVDLIRTNGSVLQFELEFVVVGRSELQRIRSLPFKIVDFSQIPSIQVTGFFVGFECDHPFQNFQPAVDVATKAPLQFSPKDFWLRRAGCSFITPGLGAPPRPHTPVFW